MATQKSRETADARESGRTNRESANGEKLGLHNLSSAPGSTKNRKRLGRGPGSGTGKTSGKGHKGIKARAGHHGPGGGKPHLGRPDADHSPPAEARVHESVP